MKIVDFLLTANFETCPSFFYSVLSAYCLYQIHFNQFNLAGFAIKKPSKWMKTTCFLDMFTTRNAKNVCLLSKLLMAFWNALCCWKIIHLIRYIFAAQSDSRVLACLMVSNIIMVLYKKHKRCFSKAINSVPLMSSNNGG